MTLKFFISVGNEEVLAFRWKDNVCSLGGFARNLMYIERLISEYLSDQTPRPKQTQKNKIRFDIRMNKEKFSAIVDSMQSSGVTMTPTKSFKRVMF